ncbi:PIN domain-containing protein [Nocardia tengchongensis]|uniref:PIN domain-containing protein n=1 Tax=Nocardia tengchongensis TaxID=2055889 RepID=UPI0036BBB3DD
MDANVLVRARLRDVLLTLAEAELYEVRWSAGVLNEMNRHLPEAMSVSSRKSLCRATARAFPDALVDWPAGLEVDVPKLVNAKDRHVVAAAAFAHAEILVTDDRALRDQVDCLPELVEAQSASVFIAFAIDSDLARAGCAMVDMAARRWLGGAEPAGIKEIQDRLAGWAHRELGSVVADLIAREEFIRHVE